MSQSTRVRVRPEHDGLRADVFLALALPAVSRTLIRRKVQRGEALLEGRRFATSARLRAGQEIEVRWRAEAPEPAPALTALPRLAVLFEDEHYIAVDKPAGLCSHPSGAVQSGTAIQVVRAMLREETARALAAGDRERYPTLAGRLDRYTSGVLLVAKSRAAQVAFQELRRAGSARKRYRAVVEGVLEREAGSIELPLGPDPCARVRIRMAVRSDGLPCRTDFRVIGRLPGCTEIEACPVTGRQHQVRAHFAAIGHPVVGDLLYGDEQLFLEYWEAERSGAPAAGRQPPRHLLHAESLSFAHPFPPAPGARVEVTAAPPPDYLRALETLRNPAAP